MPNPSSRDGRQDGVEIVCKHCGQHVESGHFGWIHTHSGMYNCFLIVDGNMTCAYVADASILPESPTKPVTVEEKDECGYCGESGTDHKHADGTRCCCNCCAIHGDLANEYSAAYELMQKMHERIRVLSLASPSPAAPKTLEGSREDEDETPHEITRGMILGFVNSPINREFCEDPGFRNRMFHLAHAIVDALTPSPAKEKP